MDSSIQYIALCRFFKRICEDQSGDISSIELSDMLRELGQCSRMEEAWRGDIVRPMTHGDKIGLEKGKERESAECQDTWHKVA